MNFMSGLMVAKLLNQSKELKETVTTINHVTIKLFTETIVRVSWPYAYNSTHTMVLEPMSRYNNQQYCTARMVV